MPSGNTPKITIGCLTVVEHSPHGLFGGYLLLNTTGRPLEFHCTAPVQPSRAQRILYGPTLEPFLYGEQIGAALISRSSQMPVVVLVDQPQGIFVRQHIEIPMALVASGDSGERPVWMADWIEFAIGQNRLMLPSRYVADREAVIERLAAIDDLFELREPFGRIREAIEEAQRTTAKAA
jgi:hypothetical protein